MRRKTTMNTVRFSLCLSHDDLTWCIVDYESGSDFAPDTDNTKSASTADPYAGTASVMKGRDLR